ncbi:MAG TPA: type II toxin-antitoxin system RelB/DinJ family antitoxin [Candidatus Agathobaculum intestinipullorum]|nr:type II toxin-antitoxin system RelB/DinJ family antitoxin [Candidatus Agathobaculum intestinipullorum]
MDTNMTFRIDNQTKTRMTKICNQLGITPSTAFNIFANAFVRTGWMPFPVRLETPAPEMTREQMLADTDDILDDYAQDYEKMSE